MNKKLFLGSFPLIIILNSSIALATPSPVTNIEGVIVRDIDISLASNNSVLRPKARPELKLTNKQRDYLVYSEESSVDYIKPEIFLENDNLMGIELSSNQDFNINKNKLNSAISFSYETDLSNFGIYSNIEEVSEENIKEEVVFVEAEIKDNRDIMSKFVEQELTSLLGEAQTADESYQRLLEIAEGKLFNNTDKRGAFISPDSYNFPEPEVAEISPTINYFPQNSTVDPVVSLLGSLSREQLAAMSADQITALVMAANGHDVTKGFGGQTAQGSNYKALPGIPSLDYRGDDLPTPTVISANDVPNGSSPFSNEQVVQTSYNPPEEKAVEVGNGENLLLKNWNLGLTGSGMIGMYMTGDPGSIVEVNEGMIIGQLGKIDKLTMENGSIILQFSSGEILKSPAKLVSMKSL